MIIEQHITVLACQEHGLEECLQTVGDRASTQSVQGCIHSESESTLRVYDFDYLLGADSLECSAISILGQSTKLSKTLIKQTMSKGAVWYTRAGSTQRIRRADKKLKTDDILHLYYDEKVQNQIPPQAQLIADEGDYSIWNKPYGMLCQGSKWGDHCTINRWAETHLKPQRPAFIVHRLDRAATGLIIIAHKKKTAAYFSALFQNRDIEKTYQAIVHGRFLERKTLNADIESKKSVSHITPLKYNEEKDQTLVSVAIETGRKHQIRRHLSEAGFPIVGDRLYGGGGLSEESENLCLTSCYLAFNSPIDNIKKEYRLLSALQGIYL